MNPITSLSEYSYKVLQAINFVRLAGSEGEQKAREIILSELKKLGVTPRLHKFQLWTFTLGDGLIIDSKERKFKGIPFGNTQPFDINGELLYLDSPQDIEFQQAKARNKIVLVYGGVRGKIYKNFLEAGVKGIIRVSPPGKGITFSSINQVFVEENKIIPSISCSYDTGMELLVNTGKAVKIKGTTKTYKSEAYNIIAEIKGTEFKDEIIAIVAHYDSVGISPGASDNGGGSVTLLALLRHFIKKPPLRTLRFIWFSGEELGLVGSQAYVKTLKKNDLRKILLVINVDVSGDILGMNRAICLSDQDSKQYLDFFNKETGSNFKIDVNIYSSDCMPFALKGIPSINLSRSGGKASFFIHTHNDTIKFVSPSGLHPVIDYSLNLVTRLANAKKFPLSRKISPELKNKIIEYFENMQAKKVKLEWENKD